MNNNPPLTLDAIYNWLIAQKDAPTIYPRGYMVGDSCKCLVGQYLNDIQAIPDRLVSVGISSWGTFDVRHDNPRPIRELVSAFDNCAPYDGFNIDEAIAWMESLEDFGRCTCGGCFGSCDE